jgi:hypothetical protein
MAQKPVPTKSDSVYKKIDEFSQDKKFFKFIHKIMFRRKETATISKKKRQKAITSLQVSFEKYNCKIIRNINIETLDPFGFSAENDKQAPKYKMERFGNWLHLKTKNWTIRNLLLFKKNEELDSLLVKESERIIRSQRYISSVIIK